MKNKLDKNTATNEWMKVEDRFIQDFMGGWSRCMSCCYFQGGNKCAAFPCGIPLEIVADEVLHEFVIDGQHGDFVYQEKTVN